MRKKDLANALVPIPAIGSDDELLTTDELASRTKVSRRTWEGRRRRGQPFTPAYLKLGHGKSARVRYMWSVVSAWLAAQTRVSTQQD